MKYDIDFFFGSGLQLTFWAVPAPEALAEEIADSPTIMLQILWDDLQQGWFFDDILVLRDQVEYVRINETPSNNLVNPG